MPGFSENDILQEAGTAIEAGQWEKALSCYQQLIEQGSSNLEALLGAGVCSLELGALESALGYLIKANTQAPADPRTHQVLAEAYRRRGGHQRRSGDIKTALESLEQAYRLAPTEPAILNDLAVSRRAQGDLVGAETLYRAAIEANPGHALLHANLGNVLEAAGRFRLAEAELQIAYDLDPDAGDIASNLAALLTKLHKPDLALPMLERAVQAAPERWDLLTNLGVARLNTRDVDGAEEALRHSLTLNPGDPEAQYNLAWVLLLTGRYEEGWAAYGSRWGMGNFSSERRPFDQPEWDGRPLEGSLLVHAEQGLGDAIQFLRLARPCKALCDKVVVEVPRPLVRLARTFDDEIEVVAKDDPLPLFQAHVPMMSLPHLLGTTLSTIPEPDGYLTAPDIIEEHLRLPNTDRLKVGFVWAGSNGNKMDRIRSMRAETLLPLTRRSDVFPVNLQVGEKDDQWPGLKADAEGFDAGAVVDDFADTAAIVAQLDGVISVDTAVVHLAGALGQRCCVMVPYMPDYRWLLNRADTPWYDSVTILRQSKQKHWTDVIERAGMWLDSLAKS